MRMSQQQGRRERAQRQADTHMQSALRDSLRQAQQVALQQALDASVREEQEASRKRKRAANNADVQNAIDRSLRNQNALRRLKAERQQQFHRAIAASLPDSSSHTAGTSPRLPPIEMVLEDDIPNMVSGASEWFITNVPGDGNCFFHALRKAMSIPTSAQELREQARNFADLNPVGRTIERTQYIDGTWVEEKLVALVAHMLRIRLIVFESRDSFRDCLDQPVPWIRIHPRFDAAHIVNSHAARTVYLINVNRNHFMPMHPLIPHASPRQ